MLLNCPIKTILHNADSDSTTSSINSSINTITYTDSDDSETTIYSDNDTDSKKHTRVGQQYQVNIDNLQASIYNTNKYNASAINYTDNIQSGDIQTIAIQLMSYRKYMNNV